jgi:hypothetical protein
VHYICVAQELFKVLCLAPALLYAGDVHLHHQFQGSKPFAIANTLTGHTLSARHSSPVHLACTHQHFRVIQQQLCQLCTPLPSLQGYTHCVYNLSSTCMCM